MSDEKELTPLQKVRAERAKRQAELDKAKDDQLALDLTALNDLEIAHGDSNVAFLTFAHTPGLPTMLIGRKPTKHELSRFRSQIKPKANNKPADKDQTEAAEVIADSVILYPDAETYAQICEERPGVRAQFGAVCLKLIVDQESEDARKSS